MLSDTCNTATKISTFEDDDDNGGGDDDDDDDDDGGGDDDCSLNMSMLTALAEEGDCGGKAGRMLLLHSLRQHALMDACPTHGLFQYATHQLCSSIHVLMNLTNTCVSE